MSQKQSQFTTVTEISDNDYIPVFGSGTNEKISKADLFEQIKNETDIFIYPTIEQLQEANLVADPDTPTYVRVEETEYRLYKITSLAAGVNDIALDNGATATVQSEFSEIGFVVGPNPSTIGALAKFSDASGTILANGPVPSVSGAGLISITDIAGAAYPKKNPDNTVVYRSPSQVKSDLALDLVDNTPDTNKPVSVSQQAALDLKAPLDSPALTGNPTAPTPVSGDNDTSISTTAFVRDAITFGEVIQSWTALSTVSVSAAGQTFTLAQHTSGGYGGGRLISKAGSVTDDLGRKKNSATVGFYLERVDADWHIEQFGAQPVTGFDNTAAINALIAAVPWSGTAVNSGVTAWLGAGVYEHGPIVVNRPVTFKGHGKVSSTFLKRSAGTGFTFQLDTSAFGGMEDLGLKLKSGVVDSATGDGVNFGSGRNFCKNILSEGHGRYGVIISEANSSLFLGIETVSNGSHGTVVMGLPSPGNNANGLTIINVDSRANGGSGLYLENCFADTIIGATLQANSRYGVELGPLNQFHNIRGTYSEANTLGSGLFNAGSNGCVIDYNIVEDANPVDNGTNNSVILRDDDTFGLTRSNPIAAPSITIGAVSSGANGVLKISDDGTQYTVTLENSGGNATIEFKSSGAGDLTAKFEKMYEDTEALTLINAWVLDASFGVPRIYKDSTGRVFLSGAIKNGTAASGTIIANVSAAYRPSVTRRMASVNSAGIVVLHLLNNGNLVIDAGTNALIALDGLNFHL